jgi:hypothetical protein
MKVLMEPELKDVNLNNNVICIKIKNQKSKKKKKKKKYKKINKTYFLFWYCQTHWEEKSD